VATDKSVKILVLYDSLTGNVEEMAKHVAAGAGEIQGVEVRLRKVEGAGELKATADDVLWRRTKAGLHLDVTARREVADAFAA
jgi:multimeric flavodoxin WrbA